MENWIGQTVDEITSCDDLLAIKQILLKLKSRLDFNYVSYTIISPDNFTQSSRFTISDYPEEWIDLYTTKAFSLIDPVIKHCSESLEPYCWDCMNESGVQEFAAHAARCGLVGGVSTGLHNRQGGIGIFSLAAGHLITQDSELFCATAMHLTALQPFLYAAISRLSSFKAIEAEKPQLSQRELTCLLWSAEGKTADEIAIIVGIKPPTVVFHLKNVISKLAVTNRNQAIAKAVLLGIITPQQTSLSLPRTYHF